MTKPLTYGSLFSGTECMSAAAIGLPLVPRFFAEVEPYPCAILRSKFPGVPNLGDVTKIKYDHETKTLTNGYDTVDLRDGLDILAGGSPCQDMSVAGKRAGADSHLLNDGGTTRSSLIFTYIRLIREIRPRWIVYENVPGLLTSNEGRDFAHFLVALAQCGYGDFAWRVLDAQYVRVDGMERAVPQRRRRVWLVGRLGANDGKSAEILLEPYGDPGDCPPRRKTREEIARSVAARAGLHGGVVARAGRGGEVRPQGFRTGSFAQFVPDEVSGTLDCGHMATVGNGTPCLAVDAPASFDPYAPCGIKTVREDGAANTVVNGNCPDNHGAVVQRVTNSNGGDVVPTLSVTDLVKQTTGEADNGGGYVCATIENHQSGSQVREAAVAATLGASRNAQAANNNPLVVATPAPHAVCYDGYNQRAHEEVSMTLRSAATGTDGNDADPKVCVQPTAYGMNANGMTKTVPMTCLGECSQTLSVKHACGVVLNPGDCQSKRIFRADGVAGCLPAMEGGGRNNQAVLLEMPRRSTCLTPGDPIQKRVYTADGPAPTLQSIAEGSGVSAQAFVLPQQEDGLPEVVVRRLTPTECERLMGLPDGWTRVTFTPGQIADPALIAYFRRVHDDWQKMIAEDGKTPKPKTEAFVRDWLAKISDPATCPDAPRFKVCGNGMCANQVRWILLNLLHSEKINPWYEEDNQ